MKEITVRLKPQNNNAKIAFGIALGISFVGFMVYFAMERYRGFVGVFALFMLVCAILLYTKYISPVFCYDLTFDSEQSPIFVVRQIIGKRQTTLSRIDLMDIASVEYENRSQMRQHKTPKEYRRYVYSPTLFPSEVYRITVSGRYEKAEIVIECTKEFADYIRDASLEAREAFGAAE